MGVLWIWSSDWWGKLEFPVCMFCNGWTNLGLINFRSFLPLSPVPMWAIILIGIVALLLLICCCVCICKKCCKRKKKKDQKKGLKGAVDLKSVQLLGNSYKEKVNVASNEKCTRKLNHFGQGKDCLRWIKERMFNLQVHVFFRLIYEYTSICKVYTSI